MARAVAGVGSRRELGLTPDGSLKNMVHCSPGMPLKAQVRLDDERHARVAPPRERVELVLGHGER